MKTLIYTASILCLSFSIAMASDDEYVDEAVDLQEVADRMNVIKAEDYVRLTAPSREFANKTAASLSEKEAKMLIGMYNNINTRAAVRTEEKSPEKIDIDPNNKEQLEEMLTPDIYTYDDL